MQVQTSRIYKLSIDDIKEAVAQYMDTNYGENIGDNFKLIINHSLDTTETDFEVIEVHVKD